MNRKCLARAAACWVLLGPLSPGARAGPVSLNEDEIVRLRALARGEPSAAAIVANIRAQANAMLAVTPEPVTQITTAGLLKGDPAKTRSQNAIDQFWKTEALALAWRLDGDAALFDEARHFLLVWALKNRATGRPIDETNLEPMIEAYDLVRGSFSAEDSRRVDGWLRSVAETELKERDPRKKTSVNNWQSHRLKTVGLIGLVLGESRFVDAAVRGFKAQLEVNLAPDGSSLDFKERDSVWYHAYDLQPLLRLAVALERSGRPVYRLTSSKGASLTASVRFLVEFAEGRRKHAEFVRSKIPFDKRRSDNGEEGHVMGTLFEPKRALPALELAEYFDRGLAPLVARLAGRPDDHYPTLRILLNAAQRP